MALSTDLDYRLFRLNLWMEDEKWLSDDGRAAERISEATTAIKNLKSGKWRLVRLTSEQHVACKVLGYDAELCDGLYKLMRKASRRESN